MGAEPAEGHDGFLKSQKTLNCIIDETALIAGAKQSTEDGIKRWVSIGMVNLFISLHSKYNMTVVSYEDLSVCSVRSA